MGVDGLPEVAEEPRQGCSVAGLGQASADHPLLQPLEGPGRHPASGVAAFSCSLHEKLQGARLGLALNSKGKILKRKEGRLKPKGEQFPSKRSQTNEYNRQQIHNQP